jgi:hypothetical protein
MATYPPIQITNLTKNLVRGGDVIYSVCRDDNYKDLKPGETWTGPARGGCLLTKITGLVDTPNGDVWATPYKSSGTSFSEFFIIERRPNEFVITRITSGSEDQTPEDYVEPTTPQR